METRLVIGMAGVILMTLLALFAPLMTDGRTCPPGIDGAGCARLSATATPQTKG